MRAYLSQNWPAWRLVLTTAFLAGVTVAWVQPTAAASRPTAPTFSPPSPRGDALRPNPSPSAEILFAAPTYFAVVVEPRTQQRRLYGAGDLIGDASDVAQGTVVEKVEAEVIHLRGARWPHARRVAVGAAIPGKDGPRLMAIVVLDGVEYHYRTPPGVPDPEPRLRHIRDRRAWLDVDITPRVTTAAVPPQRSAPPLPVSEYTLQTQHRLDGPLLERVRVEPTGQDSYAVNAADVQWALDHAGQVLQEAWGTVQPLISLQEGLRFRIQSPVADGVLGAGGFQVDSPKLAERAGLMAGDIVRSVNGHPVNGFPDLFRLYQEVTRNPQLGVVEVGLDRQGQRLTKTYRIR